MKDFFISISNYLKALIAIILGVLFPLSLLLVAYPKVLDEVIFFGFFILSVIVCILIWKGKVKLELVEFLSILALLVYTQVIRISLLAHESNNHLLIIKLAQFKLGTNDEITAAFSNLIIVSYLMIFFGIACWHISEANKGFSQNTLNTMFIDLDNRLNKGQLTEEQAAQERKKIRTDADYYSERDEIFKITFKCMIAFFIITVIHLFVGVGSDMIICKLLFVEAFTANIPLAIGATYPFVILFVLFAVTCFWSKNE